ncbi:hypothetical protein F2Q69_00051874 [Brassica cretica]|uniref:Uncharacterized protein n=1 Tax=Brassica cretica TaxID=69181 RepID=A0A8S9PXY5_BRACR|nr:hypothetical protein F2Q69_00051874 [Brassica cretica]
MRERSSYETDGEDREGGGEQDDDRREELQTTINRQPESLWICLYPTTVLLKRERCEDITESSSSYLLP